MDKINQTLLRFTLNKKAIDLLSVSIQSWQCHHFSSHSSNSKTCSAIEFHFIYKLYNQNRNHYHFFFQYAKTKKFIGPGKSCKSTCLVEKAQATMVVIISGGVQESLFSITALSSYHYIKLCDYTKMYNTQQKISIFMQVRFNSMIHNLTCILSEPPRQIF